MTKITVFGGDQRMRTALKELREQGFLVDSVGLYDGDAGTPDSSDVFLLPVPATRDGKTVYAPLTGAVLPLDELIAQSRGKLMLCGNYRPEGAAALDYCKSDGYAIKNAVPTAEGAIRIAMEQLPYTLWNSRVLLIGYGRVGRVLADRLCGMRCRLTVAARKPADLALLGALGIPAVRSDRLDTIGQYDIIFNTVDAPLLDPLLPALGSTLVVDLSSKGGFDHDHARLCGVNFRTAPGLPGKEAPETAGRIVAETVAELLSGAGFSAQTKQIIRKEEKV